MWLFFVPANIQIDIAEDGAKQFYQQITNLNEETYQEAFELL